MPPKPAPSSPPVRSQAGGHRGTCAPQPTTSVTTPTDTVRPCADRTGRQDVAVSGGKYQLHPIGWVRSPLVNLAAAPKQADEGAPQAELVFSSEFVEGLKDLHAGETILLLTWLDRARRDVLVVHPRDDLTRPQHGVFSTRSADRPNPVGLHRVEILSIDGTTVRVSHLEAIDGTPIIDVKPTLGTTMSPLI
jgi:tRNA-Thr(GGU) m(6)t(6)A37 methyltransferase TsaA